MCCYMGAQFSSVVQGVARSWLGFFCSPFPTETAMASVTSRIAVMRQAVSGIVVATRSSTMLVNTIAQKNGIPRRG